MFVCVCASLCGQSHEQLSVCMSEGCMWLLGLCCDTCKAGYKLPVKESASHKADGGVTHFVKMWIIIKSVCVCVHE